MVPRQFVRHITTQIMKNNSSRFTSTATLAAGVFIALLSACSKQERTDASAKAKEMYADSKAAVGRGWDKVKAATFDKRGDVEAHAKALAAEMDAQASKLRAN